MQRPAGIENRAKKPRVSKREPPLAILRDWSCSSALQDSRSETRSLSFLVCRMRGFDAFVASHAADPDGLCRLVRHEATVLADAVLNHGGTIDRVFAGGFSAYFDGEGESGPHTHRACECAFALVAAAGERNREHASGDILRIGIGLNAGPAILGDFGTEDRPLYAAVGQAMDMADRLERLSATYGAAILAGHAIQKEAEPHFAFLQMDHHADATGETLPIWALLGPPLSRGHPKFLALKSFHAHIFDALRGQDWAQARSLIAQCRALSGADPALYDFYLQRISHYEAHPPSAEWKGIFMPAPA